MTLLLVLLICVLALGLYYQHTQLQARDSAIQQQRRVNPLLNSRFKNLAEVEAAQQRLARENQTLLQQQTQLKASLRQLGHAIVEVQADLESHYRTARLQATGYAKDRFAFDSSELELQLKQVKARRNQLIADKGAVSAQSRWRIGGSEVEGQRRQEQVLILTLMAFDGTCEAAITQVKAGGAGEAERRIRRAFTSVNRLVDKQKCAITEEYLSVRLNELFITEAYHRQCKADREAQREAQSRMREELREARKLEEDQQKAREDESFYNKALRQATEQAQYAFGSERQRYDQKILELQRLLAKAQDLNQRATAQAQITTAGHVYVISNTGSFGKDVYKIGMTRRLNPQDRIDELSNASVPFPFDVHAVICCDNAPMLEQRLHKLFQHRRVNMANTRKEFFDVPLSEIAAAVRANHGEIHFTYEAEALEYRQTLQMHSQSS
jgi:hypothetical protein